MTDMTFGDVIWLFESWKKLLRKLIIPYQVKGCGLCRFNICCTAETKDDLCLGFVLLFQLKLLTDLWTLVF